MGRGESFFSDIKFMHYIRLKILILIYKTEQGSVLYININIFNLIFCNSVNSLSSVDIGIHIQLSYVQGSLTVHESKQQSHVCFIVKVYAI